MCPRMEAPFFELDMHFVEFSHGSLIHPNINELDYIKGNFSKNEHTTYFLRYPNFSKNC